MGPWRSDPLYPAQRKTVFLCRAGNGKSSAAFYPGLTAASVQETFPTAAEAAGNFTDVLTGPNGTPGLALKTPAVIPASCGGVLYTAPQRYQSCVHKWRRSGYCNAVHHGGANVRRGRIAYLHCREQHHLQLGEPLNLREDIVRVDEHLTTSTAFISGISTTTSLSSTLIRRLAPPGAVPVDPDLRNRPGYNTQFGWVYMIRPNFINSFKFNADWHKQTTPLQGNGFQKSTYGFAFHSSTRRAVAVPGRTSDHQLHRNCEFSDVRPGRRKRPRAEFPGGSDCGHQSRG